MKKTKILVATLTAAAITVGCGAFAACNKGGDDNPPEATTYDITFDGNGGLWDASSTVTLKTGTDGKLTALPETNPMRTDYVFEGYNTERDGSGDEITVDTIYSSSTTVYAWWAEGEGPDPGTPTPEPEHTITLVVGEGSLPAGASTTYKTGADGKIIGLLPEPTIATAHWSFDDWYDAATGGKAIVEATTVFKQDTTIYARYKRDNGVWTGDTFVHELSKNPGNTKRVEYWLGGGKISLAKGDVISLYMGGKLIEHYVEPTSAGVTKPASNAQVTSVTVSVAGEFEIYLHENANDWSCEYSGPTEVNVGSEIPEGCDAVKVTIGSNAAITFYLKDSAGNAVGKDDFSKFCIYTYSEEIFGNWAGSTTNGVLKEEMTGAAAAVPSGWIFRWGAGYGTQTANIINAFEAGKTYLVELPAANNGTAKITELNISAPEADD